MIELFNADKKREAVKLARDIVVTDDSLTNLFLVGRVGGIRPLVYEPHFDDVVPDHLPPTEHDRTALASNGVGPQSRPAEKAMRKINQIFRDRRLFAAHLFLQPPNGEFWHLIYWDQRDRDAEQNHWKHGPHVHYSSHLIANSSLAEVWSHVQKSPPVPPKSLHLRFIDRRFQPRGAA